MIYVQLISKSGTARTPASQYTPPDFIELLLEDNQRVVQVSWLRGFEGSSRKTVDWTWTVWIEARL